MTTTGKFRHLSRTATPAGHFCVMAVDHRTNLREKLDAAAPVPYTDADFMAFKRDVTQALAPHATAVLTDPAFGIGHGVADGTLHGRLGLLAPIEVTDYGRHPSQREVEYIPGWYVEQIKLSGGDGVKMLLPYHPTDGTADEKHAAVQHIVADCARWDIPFFLEPIPYSPDPSVSLPNTDLLEISVGMCQTFTAMGVDVLKLPFPVDANQSRDPGEWAAACEAVDAACGVPWALLSAGVDFATFKAQAEVACKAGASGVIVGRAVWGEAVTHQGAGRAVFLAETAASRMQSLAEVCVAHATPWYGRVTPPDSRIDWYKAYTS